MVRSYLAMIPRLSAEETLDASTAVALGSGTLKDMKRVQGDLLRAASGPQRRSSTPFNRDAMASMGLAVVKHNG